MFHHRASCVCMCLTVCFSSDRLVDEQIGSVESCCYELLLRYICVALMFNFYK